MPANTQKVDRTTKWGNPFRVGDIHPVTGRPMDHAALVEVYALWLHHGGLGVTHASVDHARRELRGKNLACWCPLDAPCHADVLLEVCNRRRAHT
jgi:hypothetical protein